MGERVWYRTSTLPHTGHTTRKVPDPQVHTCPLLSQSDRLPTPLKAAAARHTSCTWQIPPRPVWKLYRVWSHG